MVILDSHFDYSVLIENVTEGWIRDKMKIISDVHIWSYTEKKFSNHIMAKWIIFLTFVTHITHTTYYLPTFKCLYVNIWEN